MKRYFFKRLLEMIPTTLGVLLLTFALFHVVAGSPAEVVLGKHATPEAMAAFDARYGYDKPLFCGHWTRLRALEDGWELVGQARTEPAVDGTRTVPLRYPLPPGVYRVTGGNARGVCADGTVLTAPGDELTVPEGRTLAMLTVAGTEPVRLRRRTAGFWDSQFTHYVGSLLRGDFGESTEYGIPVGRVLREGAGPSLVLSVPILLLGVWVGVPLALLCAARRDGWADGSVLVFSTVLMSVNYVVWILAGQYLLAFRLGLFPVWGFESAVYLALPVLIGVFSGLGRDVRFYRAALLDEVYKPYVRTAQAKGLSEARILFRHVLRNALIPILTYVSQSVPFLFTGSLLLESFFGIPGLGSVSLNAIHSSDMAVVRGVVVIGALLYQFVNLLTDLCYGRLDPRVRLS